MLAGVLALAASPALAQSSFARGTALHWPGVLTGSFLGVLLLTSVYNLSFYVVLHERFLLWQSARAALLACLTVCLSSLPLGPWLTGDGPGRQLAINLLFDGSVAMTGLLLQSLIEPGAIAPGVRRMLCLQPLLVALTTPAMLITDRPPLYAGLRSAVLLGVLVLFCFALGQALRRGSRAARVQSVGWTGVLMVSGISLYHDIVLGRPFAPFLYALFVALAVEMLLSTYEVGARFLRLKQEHDEARTRALALDTIAHTDPLTGLPNRRALQAQYLRDHPQALALIDLDLFKAINDGYGHEIGDAVIIAAGAGLSSKHAYVARIGGEEFALLLYGERPAAQADALRAEVSISVAAAVPNLDRIVTASGGIALVSPDMDLSAALRAADIHLYAAKTAGRDKMMGDVAEAAPPHAPGRGP
jgi:diguanylate cyclase (GGDEF)-like protein